MYAKKKRQTDGKNGLTFRNLIMGLTVFFVMFAMLSAAITPDRYDIQVGQPAPNTIKATKDVDDLITTQKLKAEAANVVRSIYNVDENVKTAVMEKAVSRFSLLQQVSALYHGAESSVTDTELESANAQFAPVSITAEQLNAMGNADDKTLSAITQRALELVSMTMDNNLMESQLVTSVESIGKTLIDEGYEKLLVSVVTEFILEFIQPNYFYDEAATEAARQEEMAKVGTVSRIKGEVIVSDGEIVTEAQYKMLDSLGIIKESGLDISLYYGVALLVLILMIAVVLYIALFEPDIFVTPKKLFLLSLISIIVVGTSLLVQDLSPYLMPTTLGVLLISQLVKRRLAIIINVVLSIAISLFASASTGFFNMATFTIVVNTIVGGSVAMLVLNKKQQRTTTLLAGLCIGISNTICTLSVGLINNANLMNVLSPAYWSAGSGILAAVLSIAIMPILESVFNLVTPSKLLELSNPNQPLLRRLLLEAPGTYHHSIIVANLAEAAASEIGANGLLARVGAYYHDIGKLKRPSYFKENQMGDNPHDRTDPRVSTAILTAHTRDGVQMLTKERIPEQIIEIVRSHHGDTPVLYFYNKSRQENGDDVNVDDFRYDGPRPSSREAAIVMLADTVEAAARSLSNPNSQKLNELIRRLIHQKMDDGQLDLCSLTFNDVDRIAASFLTVLSGVFHERIEYPSIEIPKKQIQAAIDAVKSADKAAQALKETDTIKHGESPESSENTNANAQKEDTPAEKTEN